MVWGLQPLTATLLEGGCRGDADWRSSICFAEILTIITWTMLDETAVVNQIEDGAEAT